MTFFFEVLRNFWRYFRENRAYVLKVTQHYVIERRTVGQNATKVRQN